LNIETLKKSYPNLFKKIPEDVFELRYLLVIDVNYDDDDSDEFDAIDPEDYNFLLYVTDTLQEAVGEPVIIELVKRLKVHKDIEEFYLSDVDLYGIQTNLDEEGIAHMVLGSLEEILE
jgi:disulfide oxidoreductase YuzD